MNTLKSILIKLVILILTAQSYSQPYTDKDWLTLLEKAVDDSTTNIERQAALEFNKLINKYRHSKNVRGLVFDETLWIASMNHCNWMSNGGHLTHTEGKGSLYYTGKTPADRYDFVANGLSDYKYNGENCLYTWFDGGNSINEIAKYIAKDAMEIWLGSPGHHSNILDPYHTRHGIAFIINSDGKIFATDLFATDQKNNLSWNQVKYSDDELLNKKGNKLYKSSNLNPHQIEDRIYLKVKGLINQYKEGRLNKKLYPLSIKQARNISSKKIKRTEWEETLISKIDERTSKQFLGLIKKKVTTHYLLLEKDLQFFRVDKTANEIAQIILSSLNINKNDKYNFGIIIKKKKSEIRISIVTIVKQTV